MLSKFELIAHYIINAFSDEPLKLGKTKLAKLLWFADREYLYKYSNYLTQNEYIKMPQGPVPKNYDIFLNSLQNKGYIHIFTRIKHNKKYICLVSLKEPNLDNFTNKELKILDEIIKDYFDTKATTLSKQTHDELWGALKLGDEMPLDSVFWRDIEPPTQEDIEWAKAVCESKDS